MEDLKVPYGVDRAGELIPAGSAVKGAPYSCPCCAAPLVYRAGEVNTKHFAHPSSSTCNLESVLHITAKKLIQSVIEKNAAGRLEIALQQPCTNCDMMFSASLPINTFSGAGVEVRVGDYVCDVVGYRSQSVALAVEILNTHAVDATKAKNIQAYWVELKAEDVINHPQRWLPTQARLKPGFCAGCKSHFKRIQAVADKFGIDRSLYSPVKDPARATYIAEIETCFRCREEIPVFWWRGVAFCETPPPSPRPSTLQFRFSNEFGGSYWANTCAHCDVIQGDNHLYLFSKAPFKGLPVSTQSVARSRKKNAAPRESAVTEFMKIINRNF